MAHPTISTPITNTIPNNNTKISTKLSKFKLPQTELIPGLPNDLALECLLKVPITSHPKLRLVSNQWKSTLSHPSFFSLRRHTATATAEHLVFLTQPLSPPPPPPPSQQLSKSMHESHDLISPSILLYNLSVYNYNHKKWCNFRNIDVPTFAQCVSVPQLAKVVVLGGWNPATLEPSSRVVIIDLITGNWKEGSPMPTSRSFFAVAAVNGGVYVAGGHDGRKNALRTAEVYNVEADEWRKLPEMAEERDESHGIVLQDEHNFFKFWVVSGYGTESQGRFRSDVEYYNPESNTWVKIDGVWPYAGNSPKSTVVAADARRRPRWLSVINGEAKEFDIEEKGWKVVNLGSIPKSVSGSSSISMVDMGGDRIMVMGNGERSGEEGECGEEECGGEGMFMVEKKKICESDKKGEIDWVWEHVHAPSRFLGFPFSSSHLLV